jgi:hypothetical protein
VFASRGTWCSCFAMNSLVTLGGSRHLDGLEQRGSLSEGW